MICFGHCIIIIIFKKICFVYFWIIFMAFILTALHYKSRMSCGCVTSPRDLEIKVLKCLFWVQQNIRIELKLGLWLCVESPVLLKPVQISSCCWLPNVNTSPANLIIREFNHFIGLCSRKWLTYWDTWGRATRVQEVCAMLSLLVQTFLCVCVCVCVIKSLGRTATPKAELRSNQLSKQTSPKPKPDDRDQLTLNETWLAAQCAVRVCLFHFHLLCAHKYCSF